VGLRLVGCDSDASGSKCRCWLAARWGRRTEIGLVLWSKPSLCSSLGARAASVVWTRLTTRTGGRWPVSRSKLLRNAKEVPCQRTLILFKELPPYKIEREKYRPRKPSLFLTPCNIVVFFVLISFRHCLDPMGYWKSNAKYLIQIQTT
jgi:hypothetical protein